ncbi:MAG: hypothetical protein IJ643_10530 [Eubacterium sp.]|nr:hypothetical protein [Eubacterium sp.]
MDMTHAENLTDAELTGPDSEICIYTFYNAKHQECHDSSAVTYAFRKYDSNGQLKESTEKPVDENMIVGPTPAGGAFAIKYFFDKNGIPCDARRAEKLIGVEFDEHGNQIMETFLYNQNRSKNAHRGKGFFRLFGKR